MNKPMPAGWNKTIADLFREAKVGPRKTIPADELEWAREYERSLLSSDLRFPRQGDIYECVADTPVHYMIAMGPVTGDGEGVLLKGERVVIKHEPERENPLGAYALAVDYETVERRMVPEAERKAFRYGGFHFFFSTQDLNTKFKLVSSEMTV